VTVAILSTHPFGLENKLGHAYSVVDMTKANADSAHWVTQLFFCRDLLMTSSV